MIKEYSDPAPQSGNSRAYAEVGAMVDEFSYLGRAETTLGKAVREFRRAEISGIEGDVAGRASGIEKARELLGQAGKFLAKAAEELEDTDDSDEDRDGDDRQPNHGPSAGYTGHLRGPYKKALETRIDQAIAAMSRLNAKVQKASGNITAIPGRPVPTMAKSDTGMSAAEFERHVTGVMPPDFSKAMTPIVSLTERTEAAESSGFLSGEEAITAQTWAARFELAKAGRVGMQDFISAFQHSAPAKIRDLFNVTTTPARFVALH